MSTNISNGEVIPEKLQDYNVTLHKRQEELDRQIVGGKLLLWKASKEVTFVQNAPRGARSVEIHRTAHARLVRLKDGKYSVRTRFAASERQVGFQLIAEMREICKKAAEDEEVLKRRAKEEDRKEKESHETTDDAERAR